MIVPKSIRSPNSPDDPTIMWNNKPSQDPRYVHGFACHLESLLLPDDMLSVCVCDGGACVMVVRVCGCEWCRYV